MLKKNISIIGIELRSAIKSKEYYYSYVELPNLTKNFQEDTYQSVESGIEKKPVEDYKSSESETQITLNTREKAILAFLANTKSLVMAEPEIRKILMIKSGSVIQTAKKKLRNLGYVKIYAIQRRKGYFSAWALQPCGFKITGFNFAPVHTKGGELHRFFIYKVQEFLESEGWATSLEATLDNGKQVDILAKKDGSLMCFEIGLPPLNKEVKNCQNIFSSSVNPNKVIHLVKNSKDKIKLTKSISQCETLNKYRNNIEVDLAGNYVSWL